MLKILKKKLGVDNKPQKVSLLTSNVYIHKRSDSSDSMISNNISMIKPAIESFEVDDMGSDQQKEHKQEDLTEFDLLKKQVIDALKKYISIWKLSMFGHHHNKRAKFLKKIVKECESVESIKEVLQNQLDIMTGKIIPQAESSWSKSSAKNNPDSLMTLPRKLKQGEYCKALNDALLACSNYEIKQNISFFP